MPHARSIPFLAALAAALFAAAPAAAQVRVYVSPHIGVFFYDDAAIECVEQEGDCDPEDAIQVDAARFLGAKVGVQFLRRLAIEGNFGFASLSGEPENATDVDADEIEGNLSLFDVGLRLSLIPDSRLDLFLTGGVGGATTDFDLLGTDSFTDMVVTVGGGASYPLNDWVRLRGDVRSIVEFCEEADDTELAEFGQCLEDSALTHTELSGGAELTIF